MTQVEMGFSEKGSALPGLGRRAAQWLDARDLSPAEIAVRAQVDKRDVWRLLNEGQCGPRMWDALARAFGWDFIESVMEPAVGADPITARERQLAQRQAEVAAIHARLERERAARGAEDRGGLRVVDRDGSLQRPPLGVGG